MNKMYKFLFVLVFLLTFNSPIHANEVQPRLITCENNEQIVVDTKTLFTRWVSTTQYTNNTNLTQDLAAKKFSNETKKNFNSAFNFVAYHRMYRKEFLSKRASLPYFSN